VSTDGAIAVEREVRISASPETIFPFFTDPALMVRWMGDTAEAEAVPGGIYRVNITGTHVARGEFVEVSPYERVVFTWGWEGADTLLPGSTTVSVTLIPDGGETIVRLVHGDLPGQAAAEGHTKGWEHYLPRLQIAAAGGDPGPDPGPRI
jgi:uncharacterized protein YndB with AHSA1/START domain